MALECLKETLMKWTRAMNYLRTGKIGSFSSLRFLFIDRSHLSWSPILEAVDQTVRFAMARADMVSFVPHCPHRCYGAWLCEHLSSSHSWPADEAISELLSDTGPLSPVHSSWPWWKVPVLWVSHGTCSSEWVFWTHIISPFQHGHALRGWEKLSFFLFSSTPCPGNSGISTLPRAARCLSSQASKSHASDTFVQFPGFFARMLNGIK